MHGNGRGQNAGDDQVVSTVEERRVAAELSGGPVGILSCESDECAEFLQQACTKFHNIVCRTVYSG